MDLDAVFRQIGEYGPYQRKLIFYVFLPCMLPCAFHAYNQLFMIESLDKSVENCKHLRNNSDIFNESCKYMDYNYDPFILKKYPISKDFMIRESEFYKTLSFVLFGIGGFIGSYIFGYLQDRLGRQPAFFLYLGIECFFGIGTAFAWNYWTWTLMRMGVGFTVPAILNTPYILPIELVGPNYRTRCTIFSNIAYSLSLVLLAAVVYYIRNWKYLALVTSFPLLLYFVYWPIMPESPRWLMAVGKFDEAVVIFKKIAKFNGIKLRQDFFNRIKECYETGRLVSMKTMPLERVYGVKDLFKTPNLRQKTIIITFIWFTNTSVYVGLSYYAPVLKGDKYLNFFLAGVAELPTYIILWPAMEKYGRREILCISMAIGGIASIFMVLPNNDFIHIFYCVAKMGISSSYVVLPLFASELYPTVVRGIGMSISSVAGMFGPIVIPFINYFGIGSDYPLMVMGILLVSGAIAGYFLPETKNMRLPETIGQAEEKNFNDLT